MKTYVHAKTHMQMSVHPALFITLKTGNSTQLVNRQISCGTSRHGILPSNKEERMTDKETIWMNFRSITLSERSQTRKLHTVWFHLLDIGKSRTIGTKFRLVAARSWRGGDGLFTKGHERTLRDDRNILYHDWGGGYAIYICQLTELYTWKGELYCM